MKIGIVGFGFMGGVHLAAIERIGGVAVSAVASRTRPVAGAPRGNLHHVESSSLPPEIHWYSDWRELMDSDIDAVDICLPTHLHKEIILAAFERGKHVLCEKPMGLTYPECEQILRAANRSGRIFMVGHVLRFMYPYRYAASFIGSTCKGPVKSCKMTRRTGFPQWSNWLSKQELSGGAVLDLLIHDIDQALNFFGHPASVSAVSDGEIETMNGSLRYSSGLKVQIEGGWYAPDVPFSASFLIECEDAALSFEDGNLRLNVSGEEQYVDIPEHSEYLEELSYFVGCCTNNRAPERCLPIESAQAVRVANLLKASKDQNGMEISCG